MTEYSAFIPAQRLHWTLSLSPDGTTVAYVSDASGQFNVWTQPLTGGPARQLTFFTDQAVRELAWAPDGSRIAFTADTCGNEQTQVYLIDADGGAPVRLSAAADRQYYLAEKTPFDPSGRYLLCSGNDRDPAVPDLIVYDLSDGTSMRFPGAPGRVLFPLAISPDGRRLLAGGFGSNTEYDSYVADLAYPGSPPEPVSAHLRGTYHYPGPWDGDGSGFYIRTTAVDGDHASLAHLSIADRTLTVIDSPCWDVEDVAVSGDGRTIVWSINEDGRSVLRARHDGIRGEVPPIPDGVVEVINVSADGAVAAILLDTASRPLEVAIVALATARPVRYLTDTRPPALASAEPAKPAVSASVAPALIRYPSGDGTRIPALLYRPAGSERHPVLVSIHGGPDQQSRPSYDPLIQYLLANGIGVLQPNVRGSSGYGYAWQGRVHRDWGGVDLEDFAAAAAYLRSLDWVACDRLAVIGKSYGGFAALSCVSRLPDLWAAGVSICGPANLETLARSMPPHWATTVATVIGDPDKDADKLRERSPVTYADQIKAPLLVIQGANDPRVPKAEADQIVKRATANGAEVTYLVFDDEGHGFTNRNNDTKAHTAIAKFLVENLLR
ncbi:MAG: S9 family peptidase [Streptosporangiaceae bacterium]|nr:S9 family peptidase [Streptosporangiaceae bacterium]